MVYPANLLREDESVKHSAKIFRASLQIIYGFQGQGLFLFLYHEKQQQQQQQRNVKLPFHNVF